MPSNYREKLMGTLMYTMCSSSVKIQALVKDDTEVLSRWFNVIVKRADVLTDLLGETGPNT